jgi:hypothetical protein
MPSPFPGMDPYLEDPAFWQDFHSRFINACSEVLSEHLPDGYEARIDERLRLVEHKSQEETTRLPDVAITREPTPRQSQAMRSSSGSVATLEPVSIPMATQYEEVRDTWIEILHRPDRSLVTVIEILSPTNKTGDGFSEYRAKRFGILGQHVHLVEIDLLLSGRRLDLPADVPRGDYYAYVTRNQPRRVVDVYTWSLRDKLPTIPVPLKAPDPDIGLNIAEVFAITYDRGRYARSLRYSAPPPGPLEGDLLTWTRERAATINPAGRTG